MTDPRPGGPERSHPAPLILVVDDEPAVRGLLAAGLPQHGLAVLTAASGEEALDLYRRQPEAIAAALLDVQMPGLDGPATLAALRQLNPSLPCCFMSGHTGSYSGTALQALGAAHLIQKPFHLGDVALLLRRLVA